jgi:hypothetical protein
VGCTQNTPSFTKCVHGIGRRNFPREVPSKEAHRVRVQTRVRFQRRGFRSPIWARTPEPESKEEPDFLWSREPESKEESDLPLDSRVRVQGRVRFAFGLQSPSPRESPICFGPGSPTGSESKGESDLAKHLLRLIRPDFVWSVAEKGVVLMDSAGLWSSNLTMHNNH